MTTVETDQTVEETLAGFVTATSLASVPSDIVDRAVRALTNIVGVTLGGATDDASVRALAAMQALGGEPQARIPGMNAALPIDRAAIVDGVLAHVLDYDDTQLDTILHPSAPVMAALLPLAEHRDVSGADLLEAWIIGLEIGMRVALALGRPHYDAGWHVTGTAGGIAAAAASAHLLGLDPAQTRNALGIAATQACGHREQFGSMTKSLHVGVAGHAGLVAALLAAQGFDSTSGSIAGRRGLLHVMAPEPQPDRLTDGLGTTWEIPGNFLKPYASGVVTHPAIDAGRTLRDDHGLTVDDIEAIELRVHPLVLELTGKREPRTGLEGKFSVWHCAAMGLLDGIAGPRQFSDERVRSDEAESARSLFDVRADADIAHMTARAHARLRDGRTVDLLVDPARGTPGRELDDAELRTKFVDAASVALSDEQAASAFDAWMQVADATSVRALLDTCQP